MIRELMESDLQEMYDFCITLKETGDILSFVDVQSNQDVMKWINDEHEHIFGMWLDDQLVAVLKARQGQTYKAHSAFMTAAVHPKYRGKGLIEALSDEVYPIIKKRGIMIVRAYIYSDNTSSVKAAEKDGFIFSGSVKMHHYNEDIHQWVDDLIYHKLL